MKIKDILRAGCVAVTVAVVGCVAIGDSVFVHAGGNCPKGSARDTYTNSISECSISTEHDNDKTLMDTLTTVINVIVGTVGIVAVAMMVIGGISMATSQGDTSKVTKGKNTLIYGIAGLIICILAFAIVNFVLKSVFGS